MRNSERILVWKIAVLHFVLSVFFFFASIITISALFDGIKYGIVYYVFELLYEIFIFPLVFLDRYLNVAHLLFPGPLYWILYILNSILVAYIITKGWIAFRGRNREGL